MQYDSTKKFDYPMAYLFALEYNTHKEVLWYTMIFHFRLFQ